MKILILFMILLTIIFVIVIKTAIIIVLKDKNGETLSDVLFKEYLNSLIKERGSIPNNEIEIIKKSWYSGYAYGLKYYRNIQ